MALATLSFDSALLHRPVSVSVLLPENTAPKGVLTLLHGYSNRYDSSLYFSRLPLYLLDIPLAVVMPDAGTSFYVDTAFGQPYWQHISREIPEKLNQWLRLDIPRERCFVAGISMGGYGAAKLALSFPERYSHAFLYSPVTDLAEIAENGFDRSIDSNAPTAEDLHFGSLLGGRKVRDAGDDLFYLLDTAQAESLPRFTIYTGTEDFLLRDIKRFARALEAKGLKPDIQTSPGIHCWYTWDPFIEKMAAQIAAWL